MHQSRPIQPDPEAGTITGSELQAWFQSRCADALSIGVDPELLAVSMFVVAANRLAEAWSPVTLGHAAQALSQHLLTQAAGIDAATLTAIGLGGAR